MYLLSFDPILRNQSDIFVIDSNSKIPHELDILDMFLIKRFILVQPEVFDHCFQKHPLLHSGLSGHLPEFIGSSEIDLHNHRNDLLFSGSGEETS